VLQVANYLNYIPNRSAQRLVTKRAHMMTICCETDGGFLQQARAQGIAHALSKLLVARGYGLIYHPYDAIEKLEGTDAILCFGFDLTRFHALGAVHLACDVLPLGRHIAETTALAAETGGSVRAVGIGNVNMSFTAADRFIVFMIIPFWFISELHNRQNRINL